MYRHEEIESKYNFLNDGDLCEVPDGWLDLIDNMCQEIQDGINRGVLTDDVEFLQIKEKYGALRVYCYADKNVKNIVGKYEDMSEKLCCKCGKPATKMSLGWICPWCDDCAEEIGGEFRDL